MHSLAPIAGIDLGVGSMLDPEPPLVEAGKASRNSCAAAVARVLVVAGSATASAHGLDDVRGVGMSGSPMPRLITSMPAARLSATCRSSSRTWRHRRGAWRVGAAHRTRSVSARAQSRQAPPPAPARARPRTRARRSPVRSVRSSETSTSSSPPSMRDAYRAAGAAQVGGHRRAGGAGAGGQRLPRAALEDAGADGGAVEARRRRRWCDSGRARASRPAGATSRRSISSIPSPASIDALRVPTFTCWNGHLPPSRLELPAPVRRRRPDSRPTRSEARPSSIETVPGPVIRGRTVPAAVSDLELVGVGPARPSKVKAASLAPLPDSSASEPSGLKIRSSRPHRLRRARDRSRTPSDPTPKCGAQIRATRGAVSSHGSSSPSTIA